MYHGEVLRNETIDPEYKVRFSFNNGLYDIKDCTATFTRQAPVPKVTFDDYTDYMIESMGIDASTIQTIRLEIGKTVCDYLFSTMERKKYR
jgi:hypothetical protein